MSVVEIEDWRYMVDMGCNLDLWVLSGDVYGHPMFPNGSHICVSTPKKLDRNEMAVTTASGRIYHLGNCDGNLLEQLQYIEDDITNKGTQVVK